MGRADEVVHPWQGLNRGFSASFTTPYLVFPVLAVASTPPLVFTLDEPVQRYFQRDNPLGDTFAQTTLVAGAFVPIVLPAGLYLGGLAARDSELATAGAAALQAAAVQAVIVATLKWLTDRKGPYPDGDPTKARWSKGFLHDSKSARDFNFDPFDLEGGLRWPSGHAASNVAIVSALYAFYPDEHAIAWAGYPAALLVGIGMLEGDYHWLSDVAAGALFGHVIGWTIGRNFRARFDRARGSVPEASRGDDERGFVLVPEASSDGARVSMLLTW